MRTYQMKARLKKNNLTYISYSEFAEINYYPHLNLYREIITLPFKKKLI